MSILRNDPSSVRIGVVHLVHAKNGVEPFRRFIESFKAHPPGIPCDLIILYKGFSSKNIPPSNLEVLGGLSHISFFVEDRGYDIIPYFKAARIFPHEYFCFLNSFSVILADDWLMKMYAHARKYNVGLVGATGSWQSISSGSIAWKQSGYPVWKKLLGTPWKLLLKLYFDPFPNYHVRTTGFMIQREAMLKIRCGRIHTKMSAYRFESGKESLTKQILASGKRVLIVGRDGRSYEKENWHRSGIYMQEEQENLLIADKQTQRYALGDEKDRRYLRNFVWWETQQPVLADQNPESNFS